ncbi:hypothetical protein [Paenibacillus silviterrae]|uniref:hypothetical protein n=1 Tax=Paenibacillus silviterrae TaxID=3242194 RepID=UPI00254330EF|nr:hypothetical protein [Paenibacillus chinjuensis]
MEMDVGVELAMLQAGVVENIILNDLDFGVYALFRTIDLLQSIMSFFKTILSWLLFALVGMSFIADELHTRPYRTNIDNPRIVTPSQQLSNGSLTKVNGRYVCSLVLLRDKRRNVAKRKEKSWFSLSIRNQSL